MRSDTRRRRHERFERVQMTQDAIRRHDYSGRTFEHRMKQGDTLDSPAGMIRRDDEFLGEDRCSAPIS